MHVAGAPMLFYSAAFGDQRETVELKRLVSSFSWRIESRIRKVYEWPHFLVTWKSDIIRPPGEPNE